MCLPSGILIKNRLLLFMKREFELILTIEENHPQARNKAFKELMQLHQHYLRQFIGSKLKDRRDAEEIYLDTWNKLYHWLVAGHRQYGKTVRPLLTKIAKDFIANHRRKKNIIAYVEKVNPGKTLIPQAEYDMEKNYLTQLLNQLPEKKRKTVELFNQGFSHEEIAAMVGWGSPESSRNQLKKIRAHLKEQLKRTI